MTPVAIAFGSNVGERERHIAQAIERMGSFATISKVSSLYESPAMYLEDQPHFLNGVLIVRVSCGPRELLAELKGIEQEIGRRSGPRNGPREIDLDLITFGALAYHFSHKDGIELTIPHPRTEERRFVLEPLFEIDESHVLPGIGCVADLLQSPAVQSQAIRRLHHAAISISRI